MAINQLLTLGARGSRFLGGSAFLESMTPSVGGMATEPTTAAVPSPPAPAAPSPAAPMAPTMSNFGLSPAAFSNLNATLVRPTIDPSVFIRPLPYFQPQDRTTTQLANGAISQLGNAAQGVVREAMNTVANASIGAPSSLMTHLERFVRVGEVLNEVAGRWSETTRGDFAKAFNNMDVAKTDVMDAIVSFAILNDPDLEGELRIENTPQTQDSDLANRKVVWQSPAPGTPLEPPYTVMIAVEYTDTVTADQIVKNITDQLVMRDNFKMPRAVADKL